MEKKSQGTQEKANTQVKISKKAVDLLDPTRSPQHSKKPVIDVNQ